MERIEENSESLQIDESTSRFSSATWFDAVSNINILVGGVGGIGSHLVFLLSRLHPGSITVFDNDSVELANLSGQLFDIKQIGNKKVNAIYDICSKFSQYHFMSCFSTKYTENTDVEQRQMPIRLCGFDNMKSRKLFFTDWVESLEYMANKSKALFIDGRLNAEEFQVFCIQGNDDYNIERYSNEFLFSDVEADETVCSYKQTTFTASMIASIMTNLFINFVDNITNNMYRSLPFITEYDAKLMKFNTII